jgi:hypothetical protein
MPKPPSDFVSVPDFQSLTRLVPETVDACAYVSPTGITFVPGSAYDITPVIPRCCYAPDRDRPKPSRVVAANQARKGKAMPRTGRHVRPSLIINRLCQWTRLVGGPSKLKFWTLTFPCGFPDEDAFRVFNIMLTRWRAAVPDDDYLWVSQRQKNGTIHFHMVGRRWVDVQMVNAWVRAALINTEDTTGWSDGVDLGVYNGFDIAKEERADGSKVKVRAFTADSAGKYMARYMSRALKSDDADDGPLSDGGRGCRWACSRRFSRLAILLKVPLDIAHGLLARAYAQAGDHASQSKAVVGPHHVYLRWPTDLNKRVNRLLAVFNRLYAECGYPTITAGPSVKPPDPPPSCVPAPRSVPSCKQMQLQLLDWLGIPLYPELTS